MAVQVLVPDLAGVDTPIPGVLVVALPYDRDSIIRAMEQRASTSRPHTETLDSLFQAFHQPFLAFSRVAWQVEQLTRQHDSLERAVKAAAADSPAATELTARLRATDDARTSLVAPLETARKALSDARDTLWPRIEKLRVDARQWQVSTYAGYDTVTRTLTTGHMRANMADTTDALGWAKPRITPGTWWIHARSPDPQDPNFEWYWNVPVTGDTIRLGPATGRRLPRY